MFSFQYPTPSKNFPYYHCEDPEEYLNRSCEPFCYDDNEDDYAPVVISDDFDEDDSVTSITPPENQFKYTTIDTDKDFLRQHLTREKIIKRHAEIVKTQEGTQIEEESKNETPVIDIRPTNPWVNTQHSKVPIFSAIIEQQKTEEADERKQLTLPIAPKRRTNYSSRDDVMSDNSSVSTEKSRLCIHGKDCKNKKKCMRSHTLDEWQPNICRFNKRCRNNKCLYYHEGDDKTSYLSNIINSTKDQMAFYSKNKTMYIKNYNI